MMLMMFKTEELNVMGMLTVRIFPAVVRYGSGLSRFSVMGVFLAIRRHMHHSTGMASPRPMVTPTMAPAAMISLPMPMRFKPQAMARPKISLHITSMIWLTAVGSIFPWP